MKKFLIGIFAVALAFPAMSQITVGGSVNVLAPEGATYFSITPEVGYKLSDNFTLGLDLMFASLKYNDIDMKESIFGAGIFGRYSIPIADKVSFALKGAFDFASYSESKDKMFEIGVQPELWFNLTKTTSLWLSVGYIGYAVYKPDGGDSSGAFGLSWNGDNTASLLGMEGASFAPTFGVAFAF